MPLPAALQKFIDDSVASLLVWNVTTQRVPNAVDLQRHIVVHPGGKLLFPPSVSVSLSVETIVVLPGGTLEMQPASPDVKHEIIFRDLQFDGTLDPGHWGHGLICLGKCVIAGSPKVSWLRANRTVLAGQQAVPIDPSLTQSGGWIWQQGGWRIGDKLILPDTRRLSENERAGNYVPKWEVIEIADDFGLATPLKYNHASYVTPDGVSYHPHIGNLTRNVVIRSENNHGVRGRMLFLGDKAEVSIRHCEMESLGRAVIGEDNRQEPVNFSGLRTKPVYEDNSNWCSLAPDECRFKWPLMIHDTHWGSFKRNVIHNWAGAGVVVWSGNEIGNEIGGNLVTGTRGYSNPRNNDAEDGSAYWSRGWLSTFRNNIAAGAGSYFSGVIAGSGFNLFSTAAATFDTGMVRTSPPEFVGQWTTRDMRQTPLRNFEGNEAYGCATGMTIWNLGTDGYRTFPIERSVIKGLKAWNCWGEGFYAYPIHNVLFDENCEMVNCGDGWNAGDYWMSDCTIRGAKVIACGNVSRGTNINGAFILENCDFQTFNGVLVETRATPGTGAWCPPLTTRIVNCRHKPMPGRPLKTISAYYNLGNNRTSLFQTNAIEVVSHNGVAGDDFNVYFSQSASVYVIPDRPNVFYPVGKPVKGLDNRQAWDQYRVAICGVVAPERITTRPDVVGLVELKNVLPPVLTVNAGPDRTITLPDGVLLVGSASLPTATVGWTQVSGPGAVVFANTSSPDSRALIASAGEYVLRLLASDGELTASDTVTITVLPEPVPEPAMVSVPAAELMSVRNDLEALLEMMKGWQ